MNMSSALKETYIRVVEAILFFPTFWPMSLYKIDYAPN